MPLCTLHLLSLNPQTTVPQFVAALHNWGLRPLTVAKVIRWVITPSHINKNDLLSPPTPYDLLVILPGTKPLPGPLESKTSTTYRLQVGVPSRLINDFSNRNKSLLHPTSNSVPELTGSLSDPIVDPVSSQNLALSPDLQSWISEFSKTNAGKNAVSMMNLLAFRPNKKDSYLQYGKAFAETIGSKRGGDAKLVGHVVYPSASSSANDSGEARWDEFALAHYPSIMHFADMLGSKDYQEVNQKYRVPALEDTCILCTSEIEIEALLASEKGGPKL